MFVCGANERTNDRKDKAFSKTVASDEVVLYRSNCSHLRCQAMRSIVRTDNGTAIGGDDGGGIGVGGYEKEKKKNEIT